MNRKNCRKILNFIYLCSFYFFTYGKIILIFSTVYILIKKLFSKTIKITLYKSYKYAFLIVTIFSLSFLSAVLQGNDLFQIIRNNYYTIIFIFIGINVSYLYKNNIYCLMNDTIKFIGILSFIQILIYVLSIVSLPFHIFVDLLSSQIGYSIGFAGLGEGNEGFGMKMVTNLTSIYIFLIPYVFFVNKKLKRYVSPIIIAVILSGSLTQYSILLMYILIYYLSFMKYPILFLKKIFIVRNIFITITIIYFIFTSGLSNVIEYKINDLFNKNDNSKLTSVSVRTVQAKVLLSEFQDSYIFGKGLGYDSIKYHKFRDIINGNKKIKKYNYSMYEDQILDILMKFGLVLAIAIYILFYFYPIFILFRKFIKTSNPLYFSFIVGYTGLIIFASSNGNAFYAYTTMYIWGITIYLISDKTYQRSSILI